jgi:hypothetical protein
MISVAPSFPRLEPSEPQRVEALAEILPRVLARYGIENTPCEVDCDRGPAARIAADRRTARTRRDDLPCVVA